MDITSVKNKISLGATVCVLITAFSVALYSGVTIRGNKIQAAEDNLIALGHAQIAAIETKTNNREMKKLDHIKSAPYYLKAKDPNVKTSPIRYK